MVWGIYSLYLNWKAVICFGWGTKASIFIYLFLMLSVAFDCLLKLPQIAFSDRFHNEAGPLSGYLAEYYCLLVAPFVIFLPFNRPRKAHFLHFLIWYFKHRHQKDPLIFLLLQLIIFIYNINGNRRTKNTDGRIHRGAFREGVFLRATVHNNLLSTNKLIRSSSYPSSQQPNKWGYRCYFFPHVSINKKVFTFFTSEFLQIFKIKITSHQKYSE